MTLYCYIRMCVNVTLLHIAGLTVNNVRKALHGIPLLEISWMLWIPDSKLSEIEGEYRSDEEREIAVIRYWILRDPFASWRRVIERLEARRRQDHAIILYHYREELTGMLGALTIHLNHCYIICTHVNVLCVAGNFTGQTYFQAPLPSFTLPILPIRACGNVTKFFSW